jgi:hypothetical protein
LVKFRSAFPGAVRISTEKLKQMKKSKKHISSSTEFLTQKGATDSSPKTFFNSSPTPKTKARFLLRVSRLINSSGQLVFGQLAVWATFRLGNLPFGQLAVWATCRLGNLPLGQLAAWATCRLVNLPFGQLAVWATCHLGNLSTYWQLVSLQLVY